MMEAGVQLDVTVWYGLCAPAAVPKPVGAKLNADLHKALNAPDVQRRLMEQGVDPAPSSRRIRRLYSRGNREMGESREGSRRSKAVSGCGDQRPA